MSSRNGRRLRLSVPHPRRLLRRRTGRPGGRRHRVARGRGQPRAGHPRPRREPVRERARASRTRALQPSGLVGSARRRAPVRTGPTRPRPATRPSSGTPDSLDRSSSRSNEVAPAPVAVNPTPWLRTVRNALTRRSCEQSVTNRRFGVRVRERPRHGAGGVSAGQQCFRSGGWGIRTPESGEAQHGFQPCAIGLTRRTLQERAGAYAGNA